MKKIYLCVLALSVGSLSFAQQINNKTFTESRLQPSLSTEAPSTIGSQTVNYKAPGDTLWSEDFTGGLPAGWKVVDNTGNNYLWVINDQDISNNTETPSGYTEASAIASTSGGNHMLMFGDEYNRLELANTGSAQDIDSYFETTAIPVNNLTGVSVNFQQKFRRCCAINPSPQTVLIASTDPTFATNFQEYDMIGGIAGNVESADPMNMSINISAIAADYVGDIYLRFHMKSGSSHYFWMIDDINVVESPTNDMTASSGSANFYGVEYSRIPDSQIQSMNASMIYQNIGTADQPNSNLTVTIDDGATPVVLSTPNTTIASLETDTIVWDSLWTPPATIGKTYTVTLDVLSEDSTDATPTNNTQTMTSFTITDGIMALDDYSETPGSSSGGSGNGTTEYEAGNQFDCTVAAPLYAIEIVTGDGTPVNTFIDAVLYLYSVVDDAAVYTEVWRSQSYATTAADINTPKKFYDVAGTPIFELVSGQTYIAAVHSFIDFEYATSGSGPLPGTPTATHSFISYPNIAAPNASSTFSLTATPMIRLDLKMTAVGIEEGKATTNFSVYPNPSNGDFTINLNNDMKTAAISVKNVVGQTILNKTVNVAGRTTETISLTDYSKGVYFLTVNDETVKLIIE
jgi:hypothetical protein